MPRAADGTQWFDLENPGNEAIWIDAIHFRDVPGNERYVKIEAHQVLRMKIGPPPDLPPGEGRGTLRLGIVPPPDDER